MIGKTIARVEKPGYDDFMETNLTVIWFTDGTAVKLRPEGYEADDIGFEETTADALDQERVEAIENAIENAWCRHTAALRKHHECMQMAEVYGGADTPKYQRWYQNRFGMGHFAKALKTEFAGAMRDQMAAASRMHLRFEQGDRP